MAMERVEVRLAVSSGLLAVFLASLLSVVPDEHDALVALTGDLDSSTVPLTTATTTEDLSGDGGTINTSIPPENTSIPADPFSVYKRCPWSPEKAGDFVIDFTRNGTASVGEITIVANNAVQMERWMTLPTHVPVGVYKVSLASYDDHSIMTHWFEQNREQWFLELYDSSARKFLVTPQTTDLADTESFVSERVMSSAQLNGVVIKARAVHAAYPHPYSTQEVAPLCALLERVGDLPTTLEDVVVNTTDQTGEPATASETAATTVPETMTTTTVPTEEDPVQATEEVPVDTFLKCPIPARAGRTVVDFTRNGTVPVRLLTIVANATKADAMKGPFPMNLSSGEYVVRLASYAEKPTASTRQVWYATLFDETGKVLTKTPQSRDVPDGMGEYVSKVSDMFTIGRTVRALSATHAEYSSASSAGHAVLCAAFDLIEPIVEQKVESDPQQEVEATTVPVPTTQNQVSEVNTVTPPPAPNTVVSKPSTLTPPQAVREEVPLPQRPEAVQTLPETEESVEQSVSQDPMFETLNEGARSDRIETIVSYIREKHDGDMLEVRPDGLARRIVEGGVIDEDDKILRAAQEEGFQRRAKIEHLPDTDGDGVSDYDEMHFYGTDPANPQTAGGPLSDGARLLLGLDPLSTTYETVPVESPKAVDLDVNGTLRVYRVTYASSSSSSASSSAPVRVEGTAAPLSFVTLYLFSTPIVVTVRADDVGKFTYEFEETLEDGSHEVYVTTVNRSGRIIAKSQPFTFVKTAEAIEYAAPVVSYDPVDDVARKMVIIVFVLLGVFGTAGLVIVGVWRSRRVDVVQV